MPQQSKSKAKSKAKLKTKRKVTPEAPGITTKKSYWVMLAVVMAVAVSIAGYMLNLSPLGIAVLMVPVILLIGLIGFIRVTPSMLSISRRATFLFVGASVIGFGIWAAMMLALMATNLLTNVFGDPFFIMPSLIAFLIIGAFIGELLGRNRRVQTFFFKEDSL
jgi:NO-binding membrane sensor protein with MHYT domain